MASDGVVSPMVIKKTQDTLGKFVKKPPLSEKLLKKPPFRFLYDVINTVIKETGFLSGLYDENELVYENIKDKNDKIEFLQKCIDTVKLATKENLKVKPSKIVAGHEAEKTNELLQAIGKALEKKIDSTDAVETIRNGGKLIKPPPVEAKVATKPSVTKPTATVTKFGANSKFKQDVEKKSKVVEKLPKKPELTKKRSKEKNISNGENEKPNSKMVKSSTNLNVPSNGNIKEMKKNGESRKEELTKIDLVTNEEVSLNSEVLKSTEPLQILTKDEGSNEILENSNESVAPNKTEISKTYDIPSTFGEELSHHIEQSNNNISTPPIELAEESEPTPTIVTSPSKAVPETIKMVEKNFNRISSSKSTAELSDIIDQEAELRRQERSAKKERKKSSSGHREKPPLLNEIKNDIDQNTNEAVSSPKVSNKQMDLIKEEEKSITQMNNINARSQIPRPRTSLRPPSVRPASARPGAPRRRRDKNIEIVLQPDESVQMAGIGVRVNSFDNDLDDEGDNLIIIEDPTVAESNLSDLLPANMAVINSGSSSKNDSGIGSDSSQQGHLVQQILETQQKFSKIDQDVSISRDMTGDNEWDVATNRQRQSSAKQMDELRESIQTLTRSIHPLGKLMDFLQEDIDSMQMESARWRNIYNATKDDLKKESGLTQTAVQPLKQQLLEVENNIKDYIELINNVQLNILQNDDKIFKLLNDL